MRLQLVIPESDTGTNYETSDVGEQDGGVNEQGDDGVREQDEEPGPSSSRPSCRRRITSCIAMIVVVAKGMMVLSALFARIMNQKV